MEKYLQELNPERWTNVNIVWMTVLLEHILLLIKVVIASLINDVPSSVIEAE